MATTLVAAEEARRAQLDRILKSVAFRHSDSLRRLLKYLGEKSLLGEADGLKEYTIGLDAFHKPPSYDPRQDSIVRLQVGRLRQRLGEYYRTEGQSDPLVVDLPKGSFRIIFEASETRADQGRNLPETSLADSSVPTSEAAAPLPIIPTISVPSEPYTGREAWKLRRLVIALVGALAIAVISAGWFATQFYNQRKDDSQFRSVWTPDLATLWAPFLSGNRPVLISVGAPMFVRMGRTVLRNYDVNSWSDLADSADVRAVNKVLHSPQIVPDSIYVPLGEINSTFLLGKLLATRDINVSLAKSTELSWQQLADSNVIFVGSPTSFHGMLREMPVQEEFVLDRGSIRDLHPPPGAPASYSSKRDRSSPDGAVDGTEYALVSHVPGPMGKVDIAIFAGSLMPARVGAIQWYTDPNLASNLVRRLEDASGHLPKYYQVVFKVGYKDSVPVETTYVTHRELHGQQNTSAPK